MRPIRDIAGAVILVTAGAMPAVPAERGEKDPNLIGSDEFDGTALDLAKWEYRQLGPRRDGVNVREAVSLDEKGHLGLTRATTW